MKHLTILLYGILCLCIYNSAQAAGQLEIHITGISGEILKNAQSRLAEKQPTDTALNQTNISNFYKSAPTEIKAAIAPFGYFKPTIHSEILKNNNAWVMNFQVTTGLPLHITHLNIQILGEGQHDPVFQKLLQRFPINSGQIFTSTNYNKAKDALFNLAAANGYLAAQMQKSVIRIDLKHYTADIILQFNTGPRYYFGKVSFSDNPFASAFLQRYLPFKFGEPYTAEKLNQFQQVLTDSNYFQQVVVTPQTDQSTNLSVPIDVQLTPRSSRQYTIGGGFGTDTGARGLLGIDLRRLTSSGQRFNAQLQASQVDTSLQANYIIPGKNPISEQYVISSAIEQEDQVNGNGNIQKIGGSYVSLVKGWQQTVSLTLQRERFTITNFPAQEAVMLIPGINWMKLVTNDPLRPSQGYRINASMLGASPAVLANTNFFQAQITAKTIQSFSKRNRLLLRGALGYTAINDINKLPLSLQLFAGGSQSVRGYGYNTIGPGKYLTVGSVEYRYRVIKNWYAATFIDAGRVSDKILGKLQKGVGIGAVWQSPVGALELTLARAQDYSGHPLSIQFSMGSDL